jgi:glycosyltransferase involved in cell wall biosynthesis
LGHGKYGVLVPVGDVEQLRHQIDLLLRSAEAREKLIPLSRRRARDYEVGAIFQKYLSAANRIPPGII